MSNLGRYVNKATNLGRKSFVTNLSHVTLLKIQQSRLRFSERLELMKVFAHNKLAFSLSVVCALTAVGQSDEHGQPSIVPHRPNAGTHGAPTAGSTSTITPTIQYHGGPVMGTPTPYLIWYGNWNTTGSDSASGQQIVRDFVHGLSGSNYYKTNTSYSGVSGNLGAASEYTDNYSQGSSLSDKQVAAVVSHAIANGLGPKTGDSNGIYMVLTSSDVNETSGFCTQYCGWHTYSTTIVGSVIIKYAFVGNANRCLNACAAQTTSPNGNAGVDGMVSVVAHEMEETNTDPQLNAWYDRRGSEDADKCAWTFGSHQTYASGYYYNVTLPALSVASRHYLIQRELDSSSKCYIDYVNKLQ